MENKPNNVAYIVTKQFDAYYCGYGRVTVNPGAMFSFKNNRIYFLNSQNYLPSVATNDFQIKFFGYEPFDEKNEKHVELVKDMLDIASKEDSELER